MNKADVVNYAIVALMVMIAVPTLLLVKWPKRNRKRYSPIPRLAEYVKWYNTVRIVK